jgi:hypothetical protein
MAPIPLWSGNLRLSLVLIPVKLYPAVTDEGRVAFRMIHRESGTPIKYEKGIETERGFKEVPADEIVKGYEHAKGQHVLIKSEEIDELKLEAKHIIDLARFDPADREPRWPLRAREDARRICPRGAWSCARQDRAQRTGSSDRRREASGSGDKHHGCSKEERAIKGQAKGERLGATAHE